MPLCGSGLLACVLERPLWLKTGMATRNYGILEGQLLSVDDAERSYYELPDAGDEQLVAGPPHHGLYEGWPKLSRCASAFSHILFGISLSLSRISRVFGVPDLLDVRFEKCYKFNQVATS